MKLKEVIDKVEHIRGISDDDEAAHSEEDDLHQAVLLAIAEGVTNSQHLAIEALKTQDIEFSRWCA